jgi:hypothetical protein
VKVKPKTVVPAVKATPTSTGPVKDRPIGHRRSAATALGFGAARLPVPSPSDGSGLLLAGLGLLALACASGAFLGLVHRYRRDLGAA